MLGLGAAPSRLRLARASKAATVEKLRILVRASRVARHGQPSPTRHPATTVHPLQLDYPKGFGVRVQGLWAWGLGFRVWS